MLNVATPHAFEMVPQQVVQSVAAIGQSKDMKNFMDLKAPEFDATLTSIEP